MGEVGEGVFQPQAGAVGGALGEEAHRRLKSVPSLPCSVRFSSTEASQVQAQQHWALELTQARSVRAPWASLGDRPG